MKFYNTAIYKYIYIYFFYLTHFDIDLSNLVLLLKMGQNSRYTLSFFLTLHFILFFPLLYIFYFLSHFLSLSHTYTLSLSHTHIHIISLSHTYANTRSFRIFVENGRFRSVLNLFLTRDIYFLILYIFH